MKMQTIFDFRFLIFDFNRKSQIKNLKYLKSSSGLSLIAVMWIVTILTVLASEFMYSMQLEIRIDKNWRDQVSAFYAAKGGLETAITILRDDETGYDSLDEDWATQSITGELNNSTYSTTLVDESAKINVNTADEQTLMKAIAYCMQQAADGEVSEEETTTEAQTLAAAIIEKRPYRTVAEMAKADGMTPDLLYGESASSSDAEERTTNEGEEEEQPIALADITTVYSVDKNVTDNGGKRVNINSADANQIRQGINPEGEEIITQQEAQAIVDYRDELKNSQPGQGEESGQGGDSVQGGGQDQGGYKGIGQLLDVPAISQRTFDSIRDRITVEDEGGGEGGSPGSAEQRININTADVGRLQSLDGIDNGIAESIVRYREQKQFGNIDEIRQVKAVSLQDMKVITDRVTISDDEVLQGKMNINTAPLEILQMLPGLDQEKAQAIVTRREVEEGQASGAIASNQPAAGSTDQGAGPFTNLGQLLDISGIDEDTFKNLVDHVTYRSHAFRIESEGRSSDRKIVSSCTAVVDRTGNRINIKYWRQR